MSLLSRFTSAIRRRRQRQMAIGKPAPKPKTPYISEGGFTVHCDPEMPPCYSDVLRRIRVAGGA